MLSAHAQTQHCCTNLAKTTTTSCNIHKCCVKNLTIFKFEPTTRNMSQQGGRTRATCCAQQCWDMLRSFGRGFKPDHILLKLCPMLKQWPACGIWVAAQPHIFVQKSTTGKNAMHNQEEKTQAAFTEARTKTIRILWATHPHTASWGLKITCSPVQVDKELALPWWCSVWWWSRVFLQSSYITGHTMYQHRHPTCKCSYLKRWVNCARYKLRWVYVDIFHHVVGSLNGKTPGLMHVSLFDRLQNACYWKLPPLPCTKRIKR